MQTQTGGKLWLLMTRNLPSTFDLWTPADLWHFILVLTFCLSGAILPARSEPPWPGESQLPHLHHHHPKWQRERSETGGESFPSSLSACSVVSVDVVGCVPSPCRCSSLKSSFSMFPFLNSSHFRMFFIIIIYVVYIDDKDDVLCIYI